MENETKPEVDLSALRDEKCIPLATAIIARLAMEKDLKIGSSVNRGELIGVYEPMAKEVIGLLLSQDMKFYDVVYVFQLAMQSLQNLTDMVNVSLNMSYDRATASVFGVESERDVTLKQIDEVLKGNVLSAVVTKE